MKIRPGCIYFLSKVKPSAHMYPISSSSQDEGMYDHPVLIMDSSSYDIDVQVCVLTSFGNRSIDEKFPAPSKMRTHFLALGNTPGFDGKPAIQTTDNSIFNEYQYIRIKHTIPVLKTTLKPFKCSSPNNPPAVKKESWSTLRKAFVKQNLPRFDSDGWIRVERKKR